MAKYFNARELKKGDSTTIQLDNALEIALERTQSGLINLATTYNGKELNASLGTAEARTMLEAWETLEPEKAKRGEVVAYVRVSSADQNPERQIEKLSQFNPSKIFEERISGKNKERPELKAMLEYVREGDTVLVHTLDRLARSITDLRSLVDDMNNKGVTVHFVKNEMIFKSGEKADPASMLTFNILGAMAEFERSLIRERQREGIERAKARGVYKGRPKNVRRLASIREMLIDGMTMRTIAKELKCSTKTVQSVKNEMKQSQ